MVGVLLYLFSFLLLPLIPFSSDYFYFYFIFLQNGVLNNCSFMSENSIYFTFYLHNQVDQQVPVKHLEVVTHWWAGWHIYCKKTYFITYYNNLVGVLPVHFMILVICKKQGKKISLYKRNELFKGTSAGALGSPVPLKCVTLSRCQSSFHLRRLLNWKRRFTKTVSYSWAFSLA